MDTPPEVGHVVAPTNGYPENSVARTSKIATILAHTYMIRVGLEISNMASVEMVTAGYTCSAPDNEVLSVIRKSVTKMSHVGVGSYMVQMCATGFS